MTTMKEIQNTANRIAGAAYESSTNNKWDEKKFLAKVETILQLFILQSGGAIDQ